MPVYRVRWRVDGAAALRECCCESYEEAEEVFIGLFRILRLEAGGWGELRVREELVVRTAAGGAGSLPAVEMGEEDEREPGPELCAAGRDRVHRGRV